jgi:hypothetical protein
MTRLATGRGNLANVLKVAPAKGVKFALFESCVAAVALDPSRPTTMETLLVSCSVAGVSAALTHPLDTVKTMLAAGAQPPWILPLLRRIVAEQGPRGLLVGLGPALLSNVPFVGVSWATFTTGKRRYNEWRGHAPLHKPSVPALLGLSFLATAAAEAVAYPLCDMARTRTSSISTPSPPSERAPAEDAPSCARRAKPDPSARAFARTRRRAQNEPSVLARVWLERWAVACRVSDPGDARAVRLLQGRGRRGAQVRPSRVYHVLRVRDGKGSWQLTAFQGGQRRYHVAAVEERGGVLQACVVIVLL